MEKEFDIGNNEIGFFYLSDYLDNLEGVSEKEKREIITLVTHMINKTKEQLKVTWCETMESLKNHLRRFFELANIPL